MDERTLTALKGSIAKWEGIVAGTVDDDGPNNCPLCQEFYIANCNGCPVKEETGMTGCGGTPYDYFDDPKYDRDIVAMDELNFLRSLLPVSDHQSDGAASAAVSEADGPHA
jgi:hypothetical protein